MLSRHFFRAKALQAVYAGVSAQADNHSEVERIFAYNVSRLNDLGILQLSTLTQTVFVAERILEAGMQKFRPTDAEINPSRRLVDNQFIERLNDNFEFKQLCNKVPVDWSDNMDLFRKVINSMKGTSLYSNYIKAENTTFEDDKNFALNLFKLLMNDDLIRETISDRELIWEDDYNQIAQYNFMKLKEMTEETMDAGMPCPLAYDKRDAKDANGYTFALQLAIDTFDHIDDNEALIRKHLNNWDFERVAMMDILLINMAITEFTCCPSIPDRVTVDEYIELAKEFSTDKSRLFINGILDKILIELKVAGRVVKNERGLYDPELDRDDDEPAPSDE